MKNILTKIAILSVAVPMVLSGCIEDTEPTNSVTTEQVAESSKSLESIVSGMPAYMKHWHTWSSNAFDFGYPAIFIAMNVQTQDMIQRYNGYQHFSYWQDVQLYVNSDYVLSQINWYYLNFQVKAANEVLSMVGTAPTSEYSKLARAQALTYRSATYMDMMGIYEFMENETISGTNDANNDVTGLTVPYVTPEMSSEELGNNPRQPHDKMVELLIADLNEAVTLFQSTSETRTSKIQPDLAVAYGIMARIYQWDENYPKAAEYARLAINTSGAQPLTQAEWFDKTNGFNSLTFSSWMWGIQQEGNDDQVQSGQNSNWTSFMSPEAGIGYSGLRGCTMAIDRQLYDRIDNNDWRKLSWKAPDGSALASQIPYISAAKGATLQTYTGIKFRPGGGVLTDRSVTFATAIPLMRVEEMYLIEAEATAHSSATAGKQLLETFMKTYRYPTFVCLATDQQGVVDECFLQKRIEFWGENVIFFDYKRLNKGIDRGYEGSNWPSTSQLKPTTGRPGWMNWPFVDFEGEFNEGVKGYMNPNVGEKFKK